jgi:hypothetical protein
LLALLHEVDLTALESLPQRFTLLRQSCAQFINGLETFSNQLTEDYFSHATRRSR